MSAIDQYLDTHAARFEDELCELLRIPSVSADPAHRDDMQQAAEWVADQFRRLGFVAEVIATAGHPMVYAESPPVPGAADGAGLRPLRRAAARSAGEVDLARRSSRPGATAISTPAAPPTTRGRCSRTSRVPKPGSPSRAGCR